MTVDLSNSSPLNRQALHWLQQAKAETSDQQSYLAQLAQWGTERLELPEPQTEREPDSHDLTMALERAMGAEPERATEWLLSNPNLSLEEQTDLLLPQLQQAETPQQAAAAVLETFFDAMTAASPLK